MDLGTPEELRVMANQIAIGAIPPPNRMQIVMIVRNIARIIEVADRQEAKLNREWVGLSDGEIETIYCQHHDTYGEPVSGNFAYERAIETKLKEKNRG